MAIVKKRSLSYSDLGAIKTFIDSFNCPFVTTSLVDTTPEHKSTYQSKDLVLTFEDKGTVALFPRGAWGGAWLGCDYDFGAGLTEDRDVLQSPASAFPITICVTDTFFFFEFDFGSTLIFVYDKVTSDSTMFGIAGFYPQHDYYKIDDRLTVTELETGAKFTYGKSLNYSVASTTIQYMDHTILLNNGTKMHNDTKLLSCTKVTPRNVITFNGSTYYALGEYTLIPIEIQS